MNVKVFWVFLAALLLCFNSAGAADFEGKITQQAIYAAIYSLEDADSMAAADKVFAKTPAELRQMALESGDEEAYSEELVDIYIKDGAFLMNTSQDGQRATVIFNSGSSKVTTLIHDQKMAMVTDMTAAAEMEDQMAAAMGMNPEMTQEMMADGMAEEDLFSMKPAGETRTINGFKCELYKGTDSEGDFCHMWIHKGFSDVFETLVTAFSGLDRSDAGDDKETAFFKKIKGIPILSKTLSMGDVSINEIKSISRESVASDMFTVPADYKKMDMQEMMMMQMQQMMAQ
jgi:hypothetical protein